MSEQYPAPCRRTAASTTAPIRDRPDYRLARRRPAGRLPRLQHRALRLRRRPGRAHRPGLAAARRAELQLARIRQPRRRLALPGAVRPARRCRPARSSTPRSTTTAPSWSRPACARGDEIIGHGHTNAERQGVLAEADERALLAALPRAHRRAKAAQRRRAGCRRGSRRAPSRPTCWPRPATATPSTGATTTSRCAMRTRGGERALVGALPAGAERHPDDRRRARWTPRTSRR